MASVRQNVLVDFAELRAQVESLRVAGRTPKQIARALGVTPAVVAPIIREIAADQIGTEPTGSALIGCWISPGWSAGLGLGGCPTTWSDGGSGDGLVLVAVAREHRHGKVRVCGFLVDTFCLGLKNTIGPKIMEPAKVDAFLRDYFVGYGGNYGPTPVELAQEIVLGAVEYARKLGFEPDSGFAETSSLLGDWTPPSRIEFGCNGRPYFQQGPYDNATQIMRTLDKSVGRGKYEFTVVSAGRSEW